MQLGGDGVALHGESGVTGEEFLPGHGADALEQLLKAAGRELPQQGDDPRTAAQVDIQPGAVRPGALTEHAAVLSPHLGQAKALYLVSHQLFQPQQTGYLIGHHGTHLYSRITSEYTEKTHGAQPKNPVAFPPAIRYNMGCKLQVARRHRNFTAAQPQDDRHSRRCHVY